MRVTINHYEKKRSLRSWSKGHAISCKVEFTDEEKQIIKQSKIGDVIILNRPLPAGVKPDPSIGIVDSPLKIKHLLEKEPNIYVVETPSEAKEYEAELTEVLKRLKEYIMDNAEVEQKVTSFEL